MVYRIELVPGLMEGERCWQRRKRKTFWKLGTKFDPFYMKQRIAMTSPSSSLKVAIALPNASLDAYVVAWRLHNVIILHNILINILIINEFMTVSKGIKCVTSGACIRKHPKSEGSQQRRVHDSRSRHRTDPKALPLPQWSGQPLPLEDHN